MERNRFTFFKSYHDTLKLLNKEQRLLLMDAICAVQFLEKLPEDIQFTDKILSLVWVGICPIITQSVTGFLSKTEQLHPLGKPLNMGGAEAPCQHKEKEKEKEKEIKGKLVLPESFSEKDMKDLLEHRKAKKSPLTQRALNGLVKEFNLSGMKPSDCIDEMANRGWAGFKASWVSGAKKKDDLGGRWE